MVKRSGAHSTDMQQPESTQDVFNRCRPYAQQWTPAAERIWQKSILTVVLAQPVPNKAG